MTHAVPRNLKDFALYYWRYDPKTWRLFILQDLFHFSRYQIAFIFTGKAVDMLVKSEAADLHSVPFGAWLCAFAVLFVLGWGEGMHVWTAYILHKWKPNLRAKIRSDFFSYILGHSHSYYQDNFAGALARKVTEVAESSMRLHDHLRFSIFGSLIVMITAAVSMAFIAPAYAIGLLVFVASITLPVVMRLKRLSSRSRHFSEVRAQVTGTVVDILSNAASMRNFANSNYEFMAHADASERERRSDQRRLLTLIQIENYRRLSLVLLGGGMTFALLWGWQAGIVTIGQVGAAIGQTFSLVGATWMFGFGVVLSADELGYIDDAIRMITPPHQITDAANAPKLEVKKGGIEFRDVSFRFGSQPVFTHTNLVIQPGQKIGLIGASGAGKSTFVNLLLRLYDLTEGEILIDGQDISEVTQDTLRAQIALIPQDTSLFHRSLADNIKYGKLDATQEEIEQAARRAHAAEFIERLPERYETQVGERGIKLSAGQRQRIAIARAVLKDAPILILDEATSALDSESEKYIQDSLEGLMQGKTVIAIAHRLSTIAHLDRLIVLEHGEIVEDGTHDELLAKGGYYAKLWNMQSGGFLAAA